MRLKTGVEMEALGAALTIYDMAKSVDRDDYCRHIPGKQKRQGAAGWVKRFDNPIPLPLDKTLP